MLNWDEIDTVLLDMDGTLLDLNFDNYFWLHHVPQRYAEKYELELEVAKTELYPRFKAVEGTISWYSVDYWTNELDLDIAELKREIEHLIAIHPNVIPFLDRVRDTGRRAILVTNAHQKSLMLKLNRTRLNHHLDQVICSHDFGVPKEDPQFWSHLHNKLAYEPEKSVLVDDSLPVLRSARQYGIAYTIAVFKPDSQNDIRDVAEFDAIHSFADIMPG